MLFIFYAKHFELPCFTLFVFNRNLTSPTFNITYPTEEDGWGLEAETEIKTSVTSYDLMTFTQHGPSVKLSCNRKQTARDRLTLTTGETKQAGGKWSECRKSGNLLKGL